MSLIDQLFNARQTDAVLPQESPGYGRGLWGLGATAAKVHVDEHIGLNYSAVWACVSLISRTIASLPWHVFEDTDKGKVRINNRVDRLINLQPNEHMDAMTFRETQVAHVLTWGNGYSEIERSRSGEPLALWPISPDRVEVKSDSRGNIYYEVTNPHGEPSGVPSKDMLHFHGLGFDGFQGYSPISKAREGISAGLAMDTHAAAFFGNGANPGGVITRPPEQKALGPEARTAIREEWAELYGGSANAGKPGFLQEGMKFEPMTIPPEEAQFLESRKFQGEDIAARWFGVPPHMVGFMDHATFSNIEHQAIEFVRYTLRAWARRFELEARRKLLSNNNRFTKIDLNALLRGDTRTRGEFYRIMMDRGVYSINDTLELEDRNPIGPLGDRRFVPKNMVRLDIAGDEEKPNLPPPQPPNEDDEAKENEQVKASMMDVFVDVSDRMLSKECSDIKRMAKKHTGNTVKFTEWAEGYYSKHSALMMDAFSNPSKSLAKLCGISVDGVTESLGLFTDSHCTHSHEACVESFVSGSIDALCDDWKRERVATMALCITEIVTEHKEAADVVLVA